jgi:hypothetical protein
LLQSPGVPDTFLGSDRRRPKPLNRAHKCFQFGGTTSSFPALKRNTDQLEARLADDSNYTPFVAQRFSMVDGVTEPAATVGQAKLYVDAADGDLKVKFGDGTVKTIVTDT